MIFLFLLFVFLMKINKNTNGDVDEHIAVMEALKGVKVDGAVLVTTPQVDQGIDR